MMDGQVGRRLKAARLRKGLTLMEVNAATGVSTGNLSDLERGRSLPSAETLVRLSELYDVTTDWILKGEFQSEGDGEARHITMLHDAELRKIVKYLEGIWNSDDPELRIWAKVQFRRAFSDFDAAQKKPDAALEGASNGA